MTVAGYVAVMAIAGGCAVFENLGPVEGWEGEDENVVVGGVVVSWVVSTVEVTKKGQKMWDLGLSEKLTYGNWNYRERRLWRDRSQSVVKVRRRW